jgi:hypothetical protein
VYYQGGLQAVPVIFDSRGIEANLAAAASVLAAFCSAQHWPAGGAALRLDPTLLPAQRLPLTTTDFRCAPQTD